jgi:hypothetical protein
MKRSDISKSNSSLEKYRKQCQKIVSISNSIRYAGIINEYGRTISGRIKPGVKPLFSPNQVRTEFSAIVTAAKLREKSLTAIGKSNYIILNHKKVIILLLQNRKITYYVTFDQESIPTKAIIEKIQTISTEE